MHSKICITRSHTRVRFVAELSFFDFILFSHNKSDLRTIITVELISQYYKKNIQKIRTHSGSIEPISQYPRDTMSEYNISEVSHATVLGDYGVYIFAVHPIWANMAAKKYSAIFVIYAMP